MGKLNFLISLCLTYLLFFYMFTLFVYAEDKKVYVDGDLYLHKGNSLTRSSEKLGEGISRAIKRVGIKRKVKEYIKNCNDTALGILLAEEAMKVIVAREGACKRK